MELPWEKYFVRQKLSSPELVSAKIFVRQRCKRTDLLRENGSTGFSGQECGLLTPERWILMEIVCLCAKIFVRQIFSHQNQRLYGTLGAFQKKFAI